MGGPGCISGYAVSLVPDEACKLLRTGGSGPRPGHLSRRPPFPLCVQEFGFSDADFLYVVERFPAVLLCRAEGNLRPKLRYFRSLGLSRPQLVAMVKAYPCLLAKNLHSAIKPKVTQPPRQGLPDGRDVLPKNYSGCFPIADHISDVQSSRLVHLLRNCPLIASCATELEVGSLYSLPRGGLLSHPGPTTVPNKARYEAGARRGTSSRAGSGRL
jgi:hypothetical protein